MMIIKKINLSENSVFQNDDLKIAVDNGIQIAVDYSKVLGLGERFNSINQKGNKMVNRVEEKFCYQGDHTYFPLPFFVIDSGYGFFIDTKEVVEFSFNEIIHVDYNSILDSELYVFKGEYKEIVKDFIKVTGSVKTAPQWIFGPWISAHRWNSQEMVEDVMSKIKSYTIPVTVMVLEQWSDEATFYIFNGAKYPDKEVLSYGDYDYSDSPWHDPKGMIDKLHDNGIKLLLWQCPVVKHIPEDEPYNERHSQECKKAEKEKLVVLAGDEPYRIPDDNWFDGSMIPDFTNPSTDKWWFGNRQYLIDIGVDGFKTDGGEFIYGKAQNFANETELELKNNYSLEYGKAYHKFLGDDKVAFSRAGYTGQQTHTLMWAGDQKSAFEELRSVYNAGISASICGQVNWGFDIAGFSGELPSKDLYYRATQLAVFSPIMQVHSEPIGGQFSIADPTRIFNNERTPWNVADGDEKMFKDIVDLYRLRMNLVPYIYSEYLKAIKDNTTLMKHMNIDYLGEFPEEQFMFGGIVVAPILEEVCKRKEIVLPEGEFYHLITSEKIVGTVEYEDVGVNDIFAFVSSGTAVVTGYKELICKDISNSLEFNHLFFRLYGRKGSYRYVDDRNMFVISWDRNHVDIKGEVFCEIDYEFVL